MQFIGSEHFAILYVEDDEHISHTILWNFDEDDKVYQEYQFIDGGKENGK